jgi:hypothetical protein
MEQLGPWGPAWGSDVVSEAATILTEIVTPSLEALLTVDSVARAEGVDLALDPDSTVAGFVQFVRELGTVCDDPDCPDHRVRPPDR